MDPYWVLEDFGDEVTRSGKPTLVNKNFYREGLEGLRTYVLYLQPDYAASVLSNSDGLRLGLELGLCETNTPDIHQRMGTQG